MNTKSLNSFAAAFVVLLTLLGAASVRAGTITVVPLPPTSTDIATGITTNKTYVCAFNYGSQNTTTYSVNGVPFVHFRSAVQNEFVQTNWLDPNHPGGQVFVTAPTYIDATSSTTQGAVNNQADGNMRSIYTDLMYAGSGAPIGSSLDQTYTNLVIGHTYSLCFYYRFWGNSVGDRLQQVYFNGEGYWQPYSGNPLDEDAGTNGISHGARYVEYDFTATTNYVQCTCTNENANGATMIFAATLQDDTYPYAPFITYEPVPTVVGSPAAFTNIDLNVTAIGTPSLGYQWYYNTVSNYTGATMSTDGNGIVGSTTTNLDTTQNLVDYYFVVVSNNYGYATSTIAWFNPAPAFLVQATATNVGNSYVQYSVSAQGIPPLGYQWYFNTANSYSGATPATNNGYTGSATASLDATTNLQDFYFVVVTNNYASIESSITSYNPKPAISTQPGAFRSGNSIGFNVTASGWPTLAYQWYLNAASNNTTGSAMVNGSGISGAQTASVTINNLQDYYYVVVTNYYGSVTSAVEVVDLTPLRVIAAGEPIWNQSNNETNVIVYFSDLVDPATATTVGNYMLSGGSISSAALAGSNEVVLTTSPLSGTQTLTVQNVEDYYELAMTPSPTNLTVGLYPANLALWLKANAANVTPDNLGYNGVWVWNDLSGNNNTLYGFDENQAPYDPVLATNAWGDTVIRFAGTNETEMFAESSPSLAITSPNMSIIAVVNFATLSGGTNGEIVNKTGGVVGTVNTENIPGPYDYYAGGADAALYRGNGQGSGDGVSYGQYTAPNGPSVGVPHILAVSETYNTVSHYVDGNLVGTGILNGSFPVSSIADAGNSMYLGSRSDNANWLSGDLAELIVAGSTLSTYDVAQLDAYLAQAHNLALPGTSPVHLSSSVTANQLTLSWPTSYTGWALQMQTDSVSAGIGTNWTTVGGSTSTNVVVIPINPNNGCVFYRLIYAP